MLDGIQTEFCRHCGASFPHRYGEGRCEKCLPQAFSELEDVVQAQQRIVTDTVYGPDPGRCRFNCRTAKENWIDGYRTAAINADPDMRDTGRSLDEEAENEWKKRKRRQAKTD